MPFVQITCPEFSKANARSVSDKVAKLRSTVSAVFQHEPFGDTFSEKSWFAGRRSSECAEKPAYRSSDSVSLTASRFIV